MSLSARPGTQLRAGQLRPENRRVAVVLFCFLIWCVLIVARLSQLMVFQRAQHLEAMARESVYRGTIPSLRGRILDRDGQPLAWSTRHFRLCWLLPTDPESTVAHAHRIHGMVELGERWSDVAIRENCGHRVVLKDVLTPADMTVLPRLCGRISGLKVESFFIRHHRQGAEELLCLGQVHFDDGTEMGVSGLEKEHDAILRGRPGIYQIMLDRRGRWMPETWRKVREIQPGYDVYLPIRVAGSRT